MQSSISGGHCVVPFDVKERSFDRFFVRSIRQLFHSGTRSLDLAPIFLNARCSRRKKKRNENKIKASIGSARLGEFGVLEIDRSAQIQIDSWIERWMDGQTRYLTEQASLLFPKIDNSKIFICAGCYDRLFFLFWCLFCWASPPIESKSVSMSMSVRVSVCVILRLTISEDWLAAWQKKEVIAHYRFPLFFFSSRSNGLLIRSSFHFIVS